MSKTLRTTLSLIHQTVNKTDIQETLLLVYIIFYYLQFLLYYLLFLHCFICSVFFLFLPAICFITAIKLLNDKIELLMLFIVFVLSL
jgi:hypothetical protein